MQNEVIRDLTRSPSKRAQFAVQQAEPPPISDDYPIPKGAENIQYNRRGEVESFELPDYVGDEFGDIDWDDYDYDEIYDEVGDEEEDSYGEDGG